jgi:23S rRNA (uracil1939-C5)-methyltransferase
MPAVHDPSDPTSAFDREVRELLIERVGAQGDGIGAGPTFVPLTLPGERVLASGLGERARLIEVLRPSAERVTPPCPYFGQCGGCAFQHWDHTPYLAWKVEQVRLALAREGIETDFATAFAARPGERRRVALHARKGNRGLAVLGFKARRSWSVIDIDECVIAVPQITAALPALARFAAPFFQHPKSAPILHVTATETGLDIDVTGVEARSGGLSADNRVKIAARAAEADFARATLDGEPLYQARQPVVRFGDAVVVLPPGGFLQAVARAEEAMATVASDALAGLDRVADLFCGSGAFSFRLAKRASVLALDSEPAAIAALQGGRGVTPNLKAITAEARDLFRRPFLAMEMKKLDGVLFDPPRAGAAEQAGEIARSKVGVVVGVSCNPATFARDAAVLIAGGFRLDEVKPVDQFLWSPHIELVGVFRR